MQQAFYTGISISEPNTTTYLNDMINANTSSLLYCPYYKNYINNKEESILCIGMNHRVLQNQQVSVASGSYYHIITLTGDNTTTRIAKTRLIGQYILKQNCVQLMSEILWSRDHMTCNVRSQTTTAPDNKLSSQQDSIFLRVAKNQEVLEKYIILILQVIYMPIKI